MSKAKAKAKAVKKEKDKDPWNAVTEEFDVTDLSQGNLIKIGKEQAQEQIIIALRHMGWEMEQFKELDVELAAVQHYFADIDTEDRESGQMMCTGMVMFDRVLKQEIGEEFFEPWKTRYTMQIPAWGLRCLHVHETAQLMRTLQKGAKGAMKELAWERGRELQEAGKKRDEEYRKKKESTPRLCPFCGSQAEIKKITKEKTVSAVTDKRKHPAYAYDLEYFHQSGRRFVRYKYDNITVRCAKTSCPGHHGKAKHTEREAIAIWNKRDE